VEREELLSASEKPWASEPVTNENIFSFSPGEKAGMREGVFSKLWFRLSCDLRTALALCCLNPVHPVNPLGKTRP
jgi:hypothetical protein